LRTRQLDQLANTLNAAYNRYGQCGIPEQIFDLLFNSEKDVPAGSTVEVSALLKKNYIYEQLWNIIYKQNQRPFAPGLVQYPPLIVQLLRVRFPSKTRELIKAGAVICDIKQFVYSTKQTY
ncbi:unnamed protein product, partial [Didymodactylos carnosus]